MNFKYQIILAQQHAFYREAIINKLHYFNLDSIGEADTANELLELLDDQLECIVIIDLEMPELGGLSTIVKILSKRPLAKLLIISQYNDSHFIEKFKQAGVHGYLPKCALSTDGRSLAEAILTIKKGKRHFQYENKDEVPIRYTRRELEIIPLICDGKTSKEMAGVLGICEKAIEKHRTNLLEKSNTKNVASFIKYSVKRGYDFLGVKY